MDTDVLVIGGGISGCSLAYFLAKEGVEIILLEKSGLNSQASGANSGSIHGQIPHDVFLEKGEDWALGFGPTLGFMAESVTLWKAMEEMLGADLEFRLTGGLLVAMERCKKFGGKLGLKENLVSKWKCWIRKICNRLRPIFQKVWWAAPFILKKERLILC